MVSYTNKASAINQNGDVTGYGEYANGYKGAYIYSTRTGTTQQLGTTANSAYSYAEAISSNGSVAGYVGGLPGGIEHAMLYSNGVMQDIGTLPGGYNSYAYGVNDSGEVIGSSSGSFTTSRLEEHAFLYQNGKMLDLGVLSLSNAFGSSQAFGINNAGDVVGDSGDPFLYHNGQMYDLFSLASDGNNWTNGAAYAINDSGQIVGSAYHNGYLTNFIATPRAVPAPSSLLVLLAGGAMLAMRLRRKRA